MRPLALALLSTLAFPVSVQAVDISKDNGLSEMSCGPTALFVVARALGTDLTLSEAAGKLRTERGQKPSAAYTDAMLSPFLPGPAGASRS